MRTYLVTGATSGIGKAFIESYADNPEVNFKVIVRNKNKLVQIYNSIKESRIDVIEADLEDVSSLECLLKDKLSSIDGFVYCAGLFDLRTIEKSSYKRFLRVMNVNFFAFAEICRLLLAQKKDDRSLRIVAMSSMASINPGGFNQMYSASKAAMDNFVTALSRQTRGRNIEVNSIQPAFVDTPMTEILKPFYGDNFDNWIKSIQPEGLISKDEIVEQIRFLMEKKGNKSNGISIRVNAGI